MINELFIPPIIDTLLKEAATLVVSISGGKDSQTMLNRLIIEYHRRGWTGLIYALHCGLGRADWKHTYSFCTHLAATAGVKLVTTHRPQGDLVQEIEDRMHKLNGSGKPFWPSASSRYCTSDHKRDQADKVLRTPKPFWPDSKNRYCTGHHKTNQADKVLRQSRIVISAEGIRAEESRKRAKANPLHIRKQITAKALRNLSIEDAIAYRSLNQRLAINWYPIFHWTEENVYRGCGHSVAERNWRRELYQAGRKDEALVDWNMNPAYIYGNDRFSCALCVLATKNDLRVGACHEPFLTRHFIHLEDVSGFTFKKGFSLREVYHD